MPYFTWEECSRLKHTLRQALHKEIFTDKKKRTHGTPEEFTTRIRHDSGCSIYTSQRGGPKVMKIILVWLLLTTFGCAANHYEMRDDGRCHDKRIKGNVYVKSELCK